MACVWRKSSSRSSATGSSGNSPEIGSRKLDDEISLDRAESVFPEPEVQLEMLVKKALESSRSRFGDEDEKRGPKVVTIDQSKLFILEDGLTVMRNRNAALIAENQALRARLKKTSERIAKLEDEKSNFTRQLEDLRAKSSGGSEDRATSTNNLHTRERGIQEWNVCRWCEGKFDDLSSESSALISKGSFVIAFLALFAFMMEAICQYIGSIIRISELEVLTKNVEKLKEVVVSRENDWERALEREDFLRDQLKRLVADTMVNREILDSRDEEIVRITGTLAEKQEVERDLRSARKEIAGLKKIIVKLEKKQSGDPASNCSAGDIKAQQRNYELTEKELKWIDDITKQCSKRKNNNNSNNNEPLKCQ